LHGISSYIVNIIYDYESKYWRMSCQPLIYSLYKPVNQYYKYNRAWIGSTLYFIFQTIPCVIT
jgi:hypothetical protein